MNVSGTVLADQYARAVRLWPFFADIERGHGLPSRLLFALGSRETGLAPEYAAGKVHLDGHGWGLFGADDRWNTLDLPAFAHDARAQAVLAADTLAWHYADKGNWLDAVNQYGPASGRPAYGVDVLERREYLVDTTQETPMDLWHPRAQKVTPADGHTGLSFDGVPWKIVLHTTETDAYTPSHGSYYGNPYWPHATIVGPGASLAVNAMIASHPRLIGDELHLTWDEWRHMLLDTLPQTAELNAKVVGPGTIYQHLPIDVGGYALYSDGSVATNHANAVQCEIVWRAANGDWPDGLLETVADWTGWVQEQTGVPTVIAEMFRPGVVVASVDSPIRFGDQEWLDFCGICGHSNVPGGNDHWDPGRLPVDRLWALLEPSAPPPPDPPTRPERKKAPGMFLFNYKGAIWVCVGGAVAALSTMAQANELLAAGAPTIGDVSDEFFRQITGKA